jgi:hypothetical protein
VLFLDAVDNLKIFGPWMAAGIRSHGRALLYVDSSNGASSMAQIYGLQGEVGVTQTYGFCFGGQTASAPSGWTIDGCVLPNSKYAIFCSPNTTLDNFHIRNLREGPPRGLVAAGVIQNSTIDAGALPLSVGTSRQNVLIGDCSRWTIDKREHDYWIDSGAPHKSWTPGTGALKVRGQLVVEDASCVFHGSLVTLSTTLTASTSLECTAGTTLSGLPAPAISRSALVSVADANTGETIGSGIVKGSALLLPAISARQSVVISASYFAA